MNFIQVETKDVHVISIVFAAVKFQYSKTSVKELVIISTSMFAGSIVAVSPFSDFDMKTSSVKETTFNSCKVAWSYCM